MKKICFLWLLSITVMAKKNYSQTLVQNMHKPMKVKGFYEAFVVMQQNKLDICDTCIIRLDKIILLTSKAYGKTCKTSMKTDWITAGIPFTAGAIYPTVEDIYKWKWEQAMKGTLFSY
jgi:hypothetical protein